MNLQGRIAKLEQSSTITGRMVVMWGGLDQADLEEKIADKRKTGAIGPNDTIIITGVRRQGDD